MTLNISINPPPFPLTQPALWFVLCKEEILIEHSNGSFEIPHTTNLTPLQLNQIIYLGDYQHNHCFAASVQEKPHDLPVNTSFQPVRQSFESLKNEDMYNIISRAKQLLNWDNNTQFCGVCGHKNRMSVEELAKECSECHHISYPKIAPAILVLIWRDNELLLGRSAHFLPGVYSILAGFVEPGESLEETVVREVMEEVGIKIKNIKYFGSQAWPFPSNIMVGFTAEYDSGTIQVDPNELEDAQWFSKDNLPELPKPISLSRKIINQFLKN